MQEHKAREYVRAVRGYGSYLMVSKLGFCRLLEGEFNALAYPGGCLVTRWQWAPYRDLYGGRSIKTVGAPDLGVVYAQSTQSVQSRR